MSDSNSGWIYKYRKLIAPIGVLVAICAVVFWIYSEKHRDERRAAAHDQREKSIGLCFSFDSFVFDEACVKEALQAEYDNATEYYDLKAQQDMALWALLMFIVTSGGVAYLAITVWQTSTVLDEARNTTRAAYLAAHQAKRQADSATESMELQHKPWLDVTLSGDFVENLQDFDAMKAAQTPATIRMAAHIMIENISQWPARITHVAVSLGDAPAFTIEGLHSLRPDHKTWVDRVAGDASLSFNGSRIAAHLGLRHDTNDNDWVAFKRNFPTIKVVVQYQSAIGVQYEAGFAFKPSHEFGGEYLIVGGSKENYDKKIEAKA